MAVSDHGVCFFVLPSVMQSGNKSMIVSAVFRVILLQARLALKFSFQGPSGERCTAVVVFVRWPSR